MLFVKDSFDQFLVQMHCVEEGFDIDLALFSGLVEAYLDVTSRNHLAVERILHPFAAVIEVKLLRNLLQRCIQEHVLSVEDDDRVDDVLEVTYLMGGDQDDGVLASVLCDGLSELCL